MESTTLGSRRKTTPRRAKDASSHPQPTRTAPYFFITGREILNARPGFSREIEGAAAFGVYSFPDQEGPAKLLCTAKTEAALLRKLRKLDRWPVLVHAVKSARDLQASYAQPEPNEATQQKREAYRAIAEARNRGDEEFLRELEKEARRSAKKRRRRPALKVCRRMIEALRQIIGGTPPKALVESGSEDIKTRGLHTQLRRFCILVYRTWVDLNRPLLSTWDDSKIARAFYEACGCDFPQDLDVAWEAVKRGFEYSRRRSKKH